MTDKERISLREYETDLKAAKNLNEERIKRIDEAIIHIRELAKSERASDKLAVETALTSAKELSQAHNGLLRKMEIQSEKFATKHDLEILRSFQAKLIGGLMVVAAMGVSNLVKIWG